ncbi:MAG: molecular chaperone TorD family protein [Nitrospiraceae bacterium]|nr:molecular chaperone TorD family protein [Nitrospiraceae bacterium]
MLTEEMVTPSEVLGILSSMYLCQPSGTVIENWKNALGKDSSIFIDDLKKAINGIDFTSEKQIEGILWEFTRLFIGPYRLPCPPWESVYTSPKRLMMQESADQVLSIYREAGLMLNTADVLPDHIGAELNFLAVLLQKAHSETDQKDYFMGMAGRLLAEHLLKWVPEFTRDMENAAETLLYKALAKTTRNIIDFIGR